MSEKLREALRDIADDDPDGNTWAGRIARAALARAPESEWRPTHRHVKRGSTYRVLGEAEVQVSAYLETDTGLHEGTTYIAEGDMLTVYQDQDGKLWARLSGEFNDGRFEPASAGETK